MYIKPPKITSEEATGLRWVGGSTHDPYNPFPLKEFKSHRKYNVWYKELWWAIIEFFSMHGIIK